MASRTIGSLLVKLGFDPKEVDQGLKKFEKDLKSAGRRMESVGKTMSIGFTAPFLLAMRSAIKAYDEEALAVGKLNHALGKQSDLLIKQAAAIQKTTLFNDDAIITQQAWAASLGHSEKEIAKMTQAAIDLSTGLGIGLDEAFMGLHRTTLGVTRGLGNLVPGLKDLTKEQLIAGGGIDLITKKFDGFAIAAGETGAGALKKFENRFGDLMEQFGEAALPLLNKVIEKFSQLTDWFSKLSPATKEMIVNVGAFVALAGPTLFFTSKIIELSLAFKALGLSVKGAMGPLSLFIAAYEGMSWFGENIGTGSRFGSTQGKLMKDHKATPEARFEGIRSGMQVSDLIPNLSMAVDTPAAGGGGGGGTGQALIGRFDGIARSLERIIPMLSPFRADPINAMRNIQPGSGQMAGNVGNGGLPTLSGIGGHGQAIADMMGIPADLTFQLDDQQKSVEALNEGYMMLGNSIASVMTGMADSLAEGGNAFAAFGKAALMAAAQVAKAALVESLAHATKKGAEVAGAPGIIIGAIAGIAAISIVEGMISKMKVPKLAQGGASAGPMLAMIGDNPSGKEMALPWEKTGDFARKIGSEMGGGSQNIYGVIRGNDIHLVTSREQGYAARRGSGNLITF